MDTDGQVCMQTTVGTTTANVCALPNPVFERLRLTGTLGSDRLANPVGQHGQAHLPHTCRVKDGVCDEHDAPHPEGSLYVLRQTRFAFAPLGELSRCGVPEN
jgi:hypothetical protein